MALTNMACSPDAMLMVLYVRSVPRKLFCTLPATMMPSRSFQKRLPAAMPALKLGAGIEWAAMRVGPSAKSSAVAL